jgi:hypothetical protein
VRHDISANVSRHNAFHGEAANVLDAALAGPSGRAEAMLAPTGAFARASGRLTLALMSWRTAPQQF